MSNSLNIAASPPTEELHPTKFESCSCPFCGKPLPEGYRADKIDEDYVELPRCNKCGYAWEGFNGNPQRCPKCGTYGWNQVIVKVRCLKCGYIWNPRGLKTPCRCPKCRSTTWDKPKTPVIKPNITRPVKRTNEEGKKALMEARDRCLNGEGIYEVASELQVGIVDLIRSIIKSGGEPRM